MKLDREIDFSEYNRFFAFGCSFTQYIWPTWADIIGKHVPTFRNYAMSGFGNSAIFNQLIEAIARHNIGDGDLVMIMWSNYSREDRYVGKHWITPGNIYTQTTYDRDWVEQFACERGYYIRDAAQIKAAKLILEGLKCDWDFGSVWDIKQEKTTFRIHDIEDVYHDIFGAFKPSLIDVVYQGEFDNRLADLGMLTKDDISHPDHHATPEMHLEYLNSTYDRLRINPQVVEEVKDVSARIRSGSHTYHDSKYDIYPSTIKRL